MSFAQRINFYHQLRIATRSGFTTADSLRMATPSRGRYARLATRWAAACESGGDLGSAMRRDGEPPLCAALVEAGETSGTLPERCGDIVSFYEHLRALRGLVIAKATYPLILLHLAMAAPQLPSIIVHGEPLWTILIAPALFWAFILIAWTTIAIAGSSGFLAHLALRPPLRALALPMLAGNTCLVLRACMGTDMLHHQALRLAAPSCGNRIYGRRLAQAADQLERGTLPDLTSALAFCGLPNHYREVIDTAERSGSLDDAMQRCAILGREQFQARTMWTTRILLGTFYGIIVAFVAWTIVSMYMGQMQTSLDVLEDI